MVLLTPLTPLTPLLRTRHIIVSDPAPFAPGMSESGQRKINLGAGQYDQIDTAILSAARSRVIACHGVELGVSGGRNALGRDGLDVEKETGMRVARAEESSQFESNSAV